jgi:hypothetical protein
MKKTDHRNKLKLTFIFLSFVMISCDNKLPEDINNIINSTRNKCEFEKAIQHYQSPEDSLKLKSLYFIIRNMSDQYSIQGESVDNYKKIFPYYDSLVTHSISHSVSWDSVYKLKKPIDLSRTKIVKDIDIISSDFLIRNIDNSFKAWRYPWSRSLSYNDFCKYILPYKLKNEAILDWRSIMINKYRWVLDSVKDKSDAREAAILINNDLRKWFTVYAKLGYPWNLDINDLLNGKIGTCGESTQLAAYAMRSMGIPVTLDFTPFWANKNSGHDWNCLLYKGKSIIFMGAENNPGFEKIESSGYNYMGANAMKRKRAKIYRYSFIKHQNSLNIGNLRLPAYLLNEYLQDVTKFFVPSTDIRLKIKPQEAAKSPYVFLCIFNNRKWRPICWAKSDKDAEVKFSDMGRDIAYLPIIYTNHVITPVSEPFILTKEGNIRTLKADISKAYNITVYRKYPEDVSNKIFPNNNYEVFYWNKGWISMGKQLAQSDSLVYKNAPINSLFYIRNLDAGFQERIFTMENSKQVWW